VGYFDGLASACFKKDNVGNTVFYPVGVLAKGRILPDEATELHIRKFLVLYYKVTLPLTILLSALHLWPLVAAALVISVVWFYSFCKKTTSQLPISDSTLTLKEGYQGSARSHNKPTLWFLLLVSIVFVAAGIFMTIASETLDSRLAGLSCVIFFGLCGSAIGYMLKEKYKNS
jgi:hypothetical protein